MDLEGIKISFLERAVKWLAGGEAFDLAKILVAQMVNQDMTSEQKREAVFGLLTEKISGLSTVIINIMLEVAVLVVKSQIDSAANINTVTVTK